MSLSERFYLLLFQITSFRRLIFSWVETFLSHHYWAVPRRVVVVGRWHRSRGSCHWYVVTGPIMSAPPPQQQQPPPQPPPPQQQPQLQPPPQAQQVRTYPKICALTVITRLNLVKSAIFQIWFFWWFFTRNDLSRVDLIIKVVLEFWTDL